MTRGFSRRIVDHIHPGPARVQGQHAEAIGVPVGTVTPQEARDPWDVLITYRNFGKVRYWGADVEVSAVMSRSLAVRGSYSWTSDDQFTVVNAAGDPETVPLNAPANKGTFSRLSGSASARPGKHVLL